ncbi:MAG: prolyl aminopeptidase [Gammaproteobacteria bacterium]|nr:prolyl aminopeptidase [Gammaproteobacteria bacterium]
MQVLYPEIKPYREHKVNVDAPHVLHVEECGNPEGIPVLFLHGGPGAGCEPYHRRFFDPQKYRIVLFDQRGCGRSTPHGCLELNTTQHLVADIEAIRTLLQIDDWVLFGGSWGSTLALVYAQTHPERVRGMIVRGIFLSRQKDLDWFYKDGANRIFPDAWTDLIKPVRENMRNDLITAYDKLLHSNNDLQRMSAAKAWSAWEGHCATLRPNTNVLDHFTDTHTAVSLALIEVHYFKHHSFLEENQILRDMDRIKHIPGMIVHGRYDMICPLDNATDLHHEWVNSELQIIRDAGHSAAEAGITDALVRATDEMARKVGESA